MPKIVESLGRNHDYARVIQVIETTIERRGNGKDNPIRIVTQYWSFDGELLAEVDPARGEPCSMTLGRPLTPADFISARFCQWFRIKAPPDELFGCVTCGALSATKTCPAIESGRNGEERETP